MWSARISGVVVIVALNSCTGRVGFSTTRSDSQAPVEIGIGETCGADTRCIDGASCSWGVCDYWVGLGGSDFGPASTSITWGSASGTGISSMATRSILPGIVTGAQDWPLVAWKDSDYPDAEVFVLGFLGDRWQRLGASFAVWDDFSTGHGYSIAVGTGGRPFVAWHSEVSGDREIYVAQFDGVAWVEVGVGSMAGLGVSATGDAHHPQLAIDSSGRPVVTWEEFSAFNIYVKRFDGSDWVEVGSGSASGRGVSNTSGGSWSTSMALDDAGYPILAWFDHTPSPGTPEIYVRRFDGATWVEVGSGSASGGGISSNAGSSLGPDVAVDATGNPMVVWHDNTSGTTEIYAKRFDGSTWQDVGSASSSGGGVSSSPMRSEEADLVFDASGAPIVVWEDLQDGPSQIYVRRFDGTAWVDLGVGSGSGGGISQTSGGSNDPSVALSVAGTPFVTWSDSTDGWSRIYVRQFDGTRWVETNSGTGSRDGGLSNGAGSLAMPSVAMDAEGLPVAAWADRSSGNAEIYVSRFDGASWAELGVGSASTGGVSANSGSSSDPSLAFGPGEDVVVAWSDGDGMERNIYVSRFDGHGWTELGVGSTSGRGVSQTTLESGAPSLAVDALGRTTVAWCETDMMGMSRYVYVRRFEGNAWIELGASASGNGVGGVSSFSPSVAFDSQEEPVVAWVSTESGTPQIYVSRFDGVWTEVGSGSTTGTGVSDSTAGATSPVLVLDGSGGLVLAWVDASAGRGEIYILRFDGSAWQELGTSSASGGGVSSTSGNATAPSLDLDASGHPVVAWQDDSSGSVEIYVRHFDGADWVEVTPGSASAGGVSNSRAASRGVSLGAGTDHVCVAWREMGADLEVVLRCAGGPFIPTSAQ